MGGHCWLSGVEGSIRHHAWESLCIHYGLSCGGWVSLGSFANGLMGLVSLSKEGPELGVDRIGCMGYASAPLLVG